MTYLIAVGHWFWINVGALRLGQCWHTDVGPTLVYQRWPNVDLFVGPTLAQRWRNVAPTLAQRRYTDVGPIMAQRSANVGAPPLGQRWANWQIHVGPTLVCRRWPNVRADVGPTLGQRRNASWGVIGDSYSCVGFVYCDCCGYSNKRVQFILNQIFYEWENWLELELGNLQTKFHVIIPTEIWSRNLTHLRKI